MKYVLIRHPESMQNIEQELEMLDPLVGYSEHGLNQVNEIVNRICSEIALDEQVAVFFSPYFRTKYVAEKLGEVASQWDFIEEPLISEIQVGELEGYAMKEYYNSNPAEREKFIRYKDNKCRFWYKYPGGESPFDVNVRVNLFMNKMEKKEYETIIIISHLHLLKVLEMNLRGENLDWYENAKSMGNAEIRVIEN